MILEGCWYFSVVVQEYLSQLGQLTVLVSLSYLSLQGGLHFVAVSTSRPGISGGWSVGLASTCGCLEDSACVGTLSDLNTLLIKLEVISNTGW